jgi:hypothetical protein
MPKNLRPLTLSVMVLCAANAQAQSALQEPSLSFSGFGTVGAVRTNTDDGIYLTDIRQKRGATTKASFDVDSKLGLQLTAAFGPSFSITGQMQVKPDAEGRWVPSAQWLFGKVRLGSSGFTARVGRIGAPFFMVSDYRDVGYANLWVRPPVDVYSQVPFNNIDGADLLYQGTMGETIINAQLMTGTSKSELAGTGDWSLKRFVGLNVSAEYGPVTLRAGHIRSRISAVDEGLSGLYQALNAVGSQPGLGAVAQLASDLTPIASKVVTFDGVGASLDWKDLLVIAELTRRRVDNFVAETTGWYTTFGYRVGKWTPYVTFSRLRQDSPTSTDAFPPIPQLAGLSAAVNTQIASVSQKSTSIGFRWDAAKNIAVKGQFERIDVTAQGNNYRGQQPGLSSKPVNAATVLVDFVF